MKVLVILVVAYLVGTKSADAARGLRVKFNLSFLFNINVFYEIPLTKPKAIDDGWIKKDTPDSPEILKEFNMYCYKDNTVCGLFEPHTGEIGGLQIALCKDRFTPCHFDIEKQGWNIWKTETDGVETECYVLQQLFIDAEFLKLSAEDKILTYDTSKIVQGDKFSLVGMDKEIMDFPTNVTVLEENSLFLKKAYILWMGQHYYYNMTESTECTSEQIKPWFLLTREDQVVGCSMMTFGKMNIPLLSRDWFENPSELAVKAIVTEGPQCLYDLTDQCGAITCHVYWIENPQSL